MNFFASLLILTSVFAYDVLRAGIMYISKIEDRPTHRDLIAKGSKLVVASEGSRFDYDKRGTLKLTGSGMYWGVNDAGQFILGEEPHSGFVLKPQIGSKSKKSLSYKGKSDFELCDDDSIALDSKCEEARRILIIYEDINLSYQ